ncbi:MAG: methyltransferase domain-containing protein [Acidobacteria bacterium]|nr:methyltransferase domain-containing protein [Acidobacteriota bacterium]
MTTLPILEPLEAYALWAPTYAAEAHTPLMQIEEQVVRELLPDVRRRVVLDAACGTGRYLRELEARGARLACGLDLSEMMLRRTHPNAIRVRGDLQDLPFRSATFDVIVCGLAIGHVDRPGPCLRGLSRLLTRDGILVYSDLHPGGARAGWLRTFRGPDGAEYAVRHHIHSRESHLFGCRDAGLAVERLLEPTIDFPHAFRGWPAALIIRARKV